MSAIAISVSNVSKCYRVFENQRSRLIHAVWHKHTVGMQEVWALKNISFEVKRGEAVAIIGRNGGGKSTLLEILTGTLTPTSGDVKVNGRVSALLELGSGFNPEYSGRDNVMLNGLLLGLSREEISARFDEIEAFAEIGAAIDRPVKTYSSGMMMRLAFAVQVLCDPDILIIDEALSVGDFFFQQKCLAYIKGMCSKGVTLLFVSHDMGTVRDLCQRVVYLKTGLLEFDGAATEGLPAFFRDRSNIKLSSDTNEYSNEIQGQGPANAHEPSNVDAFLLTANWVGVSKLPGRLQSVSILGIDGVPKMAFRTGETVIIQVAFSPDPKFVNHISVVLTDRFGSVITTTGSLQLGTNPSEGKSEIKVFELEMILMIESGQYSLLVNLGYETARNRGEVLDQTGNLGPLTVNWDFEKDLAPFLGKVGLPVVARYRNLVES
jgi:lipopolysaccharide transport system ATP-binding protein